LTESLEDILKETNRLLKLHAGSTKANENGFRTNRNRIAASYNLMRMLTGEGRTYNDDVQSGTDSLRYFAGSKAKNNNPKDKVTKSYELMRIMLGA
jgi:hypothetical protein